MNRSHLDRRRFLRTGTAALGAAALWTPGVFAEELARTPRLTEGPFYPDKLPLDTDNDLLNINDATSPAVGEVTHLTGRVLSESGEPVGGAVVEIWQCDANGAYLHSRSGNADRRDGHFQGFGRFLTGRKGEYYFRTIKPVSYPGRVPHIHFIVKKGDQRLLTTQVLIKGHPGNARDGVLRAARTEAEKERLMTEFKPLPDSKAGELAANWDMVVGHTPEDAEHRDGPPPGRRRR